MYTNSACYDFPYTTHHNTFNNFYNNTTAAVKDNCLSYDHQSNSNNNNAKKIN